MRTVFVVECVTVTMPRSSAAMACIVLVGFPASFAGPRASSLMTSPPR